jgi:hypothetical protein
MKYFSNTSVTELSEHISSEKQALSLQVNFRHRKKTMSDVVASPKTHLLPTKKTEKCGIQIGSARAYWKIHDKKVLRIQTS